MRQIRRLIIEQATRADEKLVLPPSSLTSRETVLFGRCVLVVMEFMPAIILGSMYRAGENMMFANNASKNIETTCNDFDERKFFSTASPDFRNEYARAVELPPVE